MVHCIPVTPIFYLMFVLFGLTARRPGRCRRRHDVCIAFPDTVRQGLEGALCEGEEIMPRVIISEGDVYPTYIATRTRGVAVLGMPSPLHLAHRGSILMMAVMVTRFTCGGRLRPPQNESIVLA